MRVEGLQVDVWGSGSEPFSRSSSIPSDSPSCAPSPPPAKLSRASSSPTPAKFLCAPSPASPAFSLPEKDTTLPPPFDEDPPPVAWSFFLERPLSPGVGAAISWMFSLRLAGWGGGSTPHLYLLRLPLFMVYGLWFRV